MKTDTQKAKPKRAPKTLEDEIAALQEKLARLQAQKRDKERKDLERNQKAIATFLRTEKLDTVPIERWTAAAPALRKLLKLAEPTVGNLQQTSAGAGPEQPVSSTKAGHGAAAGEPARI
jgi:TolA-binding protein